MFIKLKIISMSGVWINGAFGGIRCRGGGMVEYGTFDSSGKLINGVVRYRANEKYVRFESQIRLGKADGAGIVEFRDGRKIEGTWKEGRPKESHPVELPIFPLIPAAISTLDILADQLRYDATLSATQRDQACRLMALEFLQGRSPLNLGFNPSAASAPIKSAVDWRCTVVETLAPGSTAGAFKVESSDGFSVLKIFKSNYDRVLALSEYAIQRRLNHQNIIRAYDMAQNEAGQLMIRMEYADGGDLFMQFAESRHRMDLRKFELLLTSMTSALRYLHARNIFHLDIKPENILISRGVFKLSDFGFSSQLWSLANDGVEINVRDAFRGTSGSIAPEVELMHRLPMTPEALEKVDAFAFGVLLSGALIGEVGETAQESRAFAERRIPSMHPYKSLILRLLELDPERRLRIADMPHFSGHSF